MIEALRKVIKRMHYPLEVMLSWVRWYAADPLSLRHIEEMMISRSKYRPLNSSSMLCSLSPIALPPIHEVQ